MRRYRGERATRPSIALLLVSSSLLAVPARANAPVRLAESLAAAILRAARGRAVELAIPEDRSGRGPGFAVDIHELVAARLEAKLVLADHGPRLRIESVLTESPGRVLASARVVEEPGGRLLDVLSVSAETDPGALPLATLRPETATATLDVLSSYRTPPLDDTPVALGFLDEQRLIALFPGAVAVFRWDGSGLSLESRRALPGPLLTVRAPAGVLAVSEAESAFWALTNRTPGAALFAVEGKELLLRHEAAALPWPSSDAGLRYRPGTNLIEGRLAALGTGPFVALDHGLAVTADGRLLPAAPPELRVGAALAALWPGAVAASSAAPPGERDAVLVIAVEASGARLLDSLPVDGAVRALARQARGRGCRLVAAVEAVDGTSHLLVFDLSRGAP